jgi:hypothetical protein
MIRFLMTLANSLVVFIFLFGTVAAWHNLHSPNTASRTCSTALSFSRRTFILQVPATVAVVTSLSVPLLIEPATATAATIITSEAAQIQWKQSETVIDDLLQNWPTVVAQGGGDGIRREIGTVGTTSPLFQIDKALRVLREEAEDLIEFTDQTEEFQLALSRADSMAYSANFAGGSGKPTPPAVYIEKSRNEVIELQKIAKSLRALL